MGEHDAQVVSVDPAIVVQVRVGWILQSPDREQATEVDAVDHAVEIEVAPAVLARVELSIAILVFGAARDLTDVECPIAVAVRPVWPALTCVDESVPIAVQRRIPADLADVRNTVGIAVLDRPAGDLAGIDKAVGVAVRDSVGADQHH